MLESTRFTCSNLLFFFFFFVLTINYHFFFFLSIVNHKMTNERTVKRIIKINKAELNIIQKGSHLTGGLELSVSHHEPPAQRCHSLHPHLRISFNSLSPHLLTTSSSSLTSPALHSFAPHGHRHFRSPRRRPIPSCFRSPSGGRNASPNQPRRIAGAIRKP